MGWSLDPRSWDFRNDVFQPVGDAVEDVGGFIENIFTGKKAAEAAKKATEAAAEMTDAWRKDIKEAADEATGLLRDSGIGAQDVLKEFYDNAQDIVSSGYGMADFYGSSMGATVANTLQGTQWDARNVFNNTLGSSMDAMNESFGQAGIDLRGAYSDALNRVDTANANAAGSIASGTNAFAGNFDQARADALQGQMNAQGALGDGFNSQAAAISGGFDQARQDIQGFDAAQQQQQRIQDLGLMTSADQLTENIEADPAFQFRLEQGLEALDKSAAARGGRVSGRTLKEVQQFAQGLASQEADKIAARRQGFQQSQLQRGGLETQGVQLGAQQAQQQAQLAASGGQALGGAQQANTAQIAALAERMGLTQADLQTQQGQAMLNAAMQQAGLTTQTGIAGANIAGTGGQALAGIHSDLGARQGSIGLDAARTGANLAQTGGHALASFQQQQMRDYINRALGHSGTSADLSTSLGTSLANLGTGTAAAMASALTNTPVQMMQAQQPLLGAKTNQFATQAQPSFLEQLTRQGVITGIGYALGGPAGGAATNLAAGGAGGGNNFVGIPPPSSGIIVR